MGGGAQSLDRRPEPARETSGGTQTHTDVDSEARPSDRSGATRAPRQQLAARGGSARRRPRRHAADCARPGPLGLWPGADPGFGYEGLRCVGHPSGADLRRAGQAGQSRRRLPGRDDAGDRRRTRHSRHDRERRGQVQPPAGPARSVQDVDGRIAALACARPRAAQPLADHHDVDLNLDHLDLVNDDHVIVDDNHVDDGATRLCRDDAAHWRAERRRGRARSTTSSTARRSIRRSGSRNSPERAGTRRASHRTRCVT